MDDDNIITEYYEKVHQYNRLLKDLNVKIDDLEIEIEELRKLINELYLQIKTEMIILAHQLLPILLPIIKQQIEDIVNQRIPGPLKIPVDNVINKIL